MRHISTLIFRSCSFGLCGMRTLCVWNWIIYESFSLPAMEAFLESIFKRNERAISHPCVCDLLCDTFQAVLWDFFMASKNRVKILPNFNQNFWEISSIQKTIPHAMSSSTGNLLHWNHRKESTCSFASMHQKLENSSNRVYCYFVVLNFIALSEKTFWNLIRFMMNIREWIEFLLMGRLIEM